ncbi:hypothetical protein ACEPPU_07245 [Priestia aryabhattai]|uniref:hypothetical protein n=1 Tax=Priestia aryabhattai TaxID=412384 RepID=UPI0035AB7ECB
MKDLIKKFQDGQSVEVIEHVLGMVDTVENMKYTGTSNTDDGLKFIANRIRALIVKNVMKERQVDIKTRKEETDVWYEELQDFISGLADADWIDLDFRAIYKYDFTSIYNKRDEIKDYLRDTEYENLFTIVDRFTAMQSLEGNEEFRGCYSERKADWMPLFKEALEYALIKVDADKSEKEIISYINKAMMTKFIDLQMKRDNLKRIRKGNESTYVKVETDEETDVWMLMFGKTLKHIGGVEAFALWLTPKQVKFVTEVYNIIERDLKNNNVDAFKWNKDSKPVLKKRYLAEQMGMEETNFKQTLNRCKKKIFDNWKEVIASRFK